MSLRILAFDHFFDQDLDALAGGLGADERLDVLPYRRLHRLARRHFPEEAFTGLEPAYRPEMADAWTRYQAAAGRFARWLAAAYRPHVFVVPSDAFFYLRPVIEELDRIGVPTVVVQKETTISPMVMESHSASVGRTVPFMSRVMTVCSERNRQFWVRAGTPPDRVIVTGQPRFDVYASARPPGSDTPPKLLYLSYDDVAYLPSDTGEAYEGTWQELRRLTEDAIRRASGRWQVTVKRHPQQQAAPDWLGTAVTRAERDADTRRLILDADLVIGFQTTAIFEAVVAGRPVVYPAWGPVYEEARTLLTPFDEYPGMVTAVRGVAELDAVLATPLADLPRPSVDARRVAEEHLGPVDGRATARALEVVRAHAGPAPAMEAPAPDRRRLAALRVASPVMAIAARLTGNAAARRRAAHWRQELDEAAAIRRA